MGYCASEAMRETNDPLRCSMLYKSTMQKLLKKHLNDQNFEWEVVEGSIRDWHDYV
ncbi:hypothetical protein [Candidatus Endomicrobiellum trichonymphae]|uniref:hypothetical protein n=1 Tax=Endomicrobium trichonymphae TaxID=1408204 RepID=UPI000325CDC6|nr:hypothetical protein [Candidatus Endomicrobium trichonymphae]